MLASCSLHVVASALNAVKENVTAYVINVWNVIICVAMVNANVSNAVKAIVKIHANWFVRNAD